MVRISGSRIVVWLSIWTMFIGQPVLANQTCYNIIKQILPDWYSVSKNLATPDQVKKNLCDSAPLDALERRVDNSRAVTKAYKEVLPELLGLIKQRQTQAGATRMFLKDANKQFQACRLDGKPDADALIKCADLELELDVKRTDFHDDGLKLENRLLLSCMKRTSPLEDQLRAQACAQLRPELKDIDSSFDYVFQAYAK